MSEECKDGDHGDCIEMECLCLCHLEDAEDWNHPTCNEASQ